MKLKYVMIDESYPIIFTECHAHVDFKCVGNITSAGFIMFYADEKGNQKCSVYGRSVSLNLESHKLDENIINHCLSEY